jgi:hypothetical protein
LTLASTSSEKPLALTDEEKTLSDYGVTNGATLRLKDLGKQVDYRVLYLWEYVSVTFDQPDEIGRPNIPQSVVPTVLKAVMGSLRDVCFTIVRFTETST